jgi:formylmethanofuran dehydrogenase subunit B
MIGGVTIASLKLILEKLKVAQYGVVVWSASALKFPQAVLTVQSITQLIAKLNETNRVAGLPLNSGDGDSSVNNTSTWLSGYPTRNRFVNGHPEYDAYHFSTKLQLASCDALLWVSTFNAHLPPACDAPTIVIGHPDMQFEKQPDVFIPVGIPGVDHTGTMFRMDSSVAMPLKKLRKSELLSLSEVISQIEAKLS